MKKKLFLFLVAPLFLTACPKVNVPVEGIEIEKDIYTVNIGEEETINVTFKPSNASNKELTWESALKNNNLFEFTSDNVIKGLKIGQTTLTAKSVDGGFTDTCVVNIVDPNYVPVTGVELNSKSISLEVGDEYQLSETVLPSTATNKTVSWTAANPSVATVKNGLVKAVGEGHTNITVRTNDGGFTQSCTITVNDPESGVVHVESVSLDKKEIETTIGDEFKLIATVLPSDATNKSVKWYSSKESIATVNENGKVTTKGFGSTTITAKSVDGGRTASCEVTVKRTDSDDAIDGSFVINYLDVSSKKDNPKKTTIKDGFKICSEGVYATNNETFAVLQNALIYNLNPIKGLKNVIITPADGETFTFRVHFGTSTLISNSSSYAGGSGETPASCSGYDFFTIQNADQMGKTMLIKSIKIEYSYLLINPTGIEFEDDSIEMRQGDTKFMKLNYLPNGANNNLDVNWTSSNESIATVNEDGYVTVNETASIGETVTITATSKFDDSIKATRTITVTEAKEDKWTIMIYMCGADLESQNGLATSDINEILSTPNQPDDVNIIIQTGGATVWSNDLIDESAIDRLHVEEQVLLKDETLLSDSMGKQSTLEGFIEYGLTNYPAEKTGLIFWNHGGAMDGCCFDELYDNDSLTNYETSKAFENVFNKLDREENIEFIGYDCCLMAVQDVAEFNSHYANYMVCSQESETGTGWDYDSWLPNLYEGKETTVILNSIVDSFILENESDSGNNQTLSVLDLSFMPTWKAAFEEMAQSLLDTYTADQWKTLRDIINSCGKYGFTPVYADYNSGYVYDIFDIGDFIKEMKFGNRPTYFGIDMTVLEDIYSHLVEYARHGAQANGGATGLCMFFPISGLNSRSCYSELNTNFHIWKRYVDKLGVYRD